MTARRRRRTARPAAGVLVVPRDENPYQELLYSAMRHRGHRVLYVGELTRSRTLNLLLLPAELAFRRVRGYSILHVHWTFTFLFTGADRLPALRRVSRIWFELILALARICGLRIVWTAHNLFPQAPVFDDDRRARRVLVSRSDLVLAHSRATLTEVEDNFGTPRRTAVVPHGPIEPPGLAQTPPLTASRPRSVLFFGKIERYKGVEDLLAAVTGLEADVNLQIVGHCGDAALASELEQLAASLVNVTLALGYVPEADISALFASADAVIYPYRRVTTSGSVTLAAVAGRPIVIPDLPGFAELPAEAVIRYPGGVAGIRGALAELAAADARDLIAKGAAAKTILTGVSWDSIAELTSVAFARLSDPEPHRLSS